MSIHIYHHNDHDGVTAGAVVYMMHKTRYPDIDIKLYNISSYNTILDFSHIGDNEEVYIVDYSFSNIRNVANLKKLVERNKRVVWIDHHKTSLEAEREPGNEWMTSISGIRFVGICGAGLSYLYLNNIPVKMESLDKLPLFLRYVNSHDVFINDMPNTREFTLGCPLLSPDSAIYHHLIRNYNEKECEQIVQSFIDDGSVIAKYLDSRDLKFLEEKGYELEIDGLKGICMNHDGNSYSFGDRFEEYDFVMDFHYDGKEKVWTYSLYTSKSNVDVSVIAKKYGGGGHAKAAGFQSKKPLFT